MSIVETKRPMRSSEIVRFYTQSIIELSLIGTLNLTRNIQKRGFKRKLKVFRVDKEI